MVVAEVIVTTQQDLGNAVVHRVGFEDLETAYGEYERLAALMQASEKRNNDLPSMVSLEGVNRVTVPLRIIRGVSIMDYVKSNDAERGIREAFPNLGFGKG